MKMRCLILFFVLILSQTGISQDSIPISHEFYHEYEGDYYFENGSYITGGPMDEVKASLVFLEPVDGDFGGVFKPESRLKFNSIYPEGIQIEFRTDSVGKISGLWWDPKGGKKRYAEKGSSHKVENVEFSNKNVSLKGELFLPEGEGPFPLIINVHGSGPQTRHLGPWNTFFLKYGVAVLSFDKRGAGESTGDFSIAGYHDFAEDVEAAFEFARNHPYILDDKIGLHGSSEGGWVSPIAASYLPELAFMMVRVGPGVSGSDSYMHEVKNELKSQHLIKEQYYEAVRFERTIQDMVGNGVSLEDINLFIANFRNSHEWYSEVFGDYTEMDQDYYIKLQKSGPVDPVDYLRDLKEIPVLWFLAEEDENVPYEISKIRIIDALNEAGNEDVELISIPHAKHNFILESSDGRMKYVDGYWDKMLTWLKNHRIIKSEKQ